MKGGLIHGELSGEIIGAGMAVLNELKPGLDEKLYENAIVCDNMPLLSIPSILMTVIISFICVLSVLSV